MPGRRPRASEGSCDEHSFVHGPAPLALRRHALGPGTAPPGLRRRKLQQPAAARRGCPGTGGATPASLVIPDTVKLNFGLASGFPNGRQLNDPVIDITLAVLLLDMTKHSRALLAGLPLNPPADSTLLSTFPYFAPANGGQPSAGTGTAFNFRTDPASGYVRVDRMVQPAVATALIGTATKNAYNDANPSDDVANTFVPEIVAQLTLHNGLADDLIALGLTPCSK